MSILYLSDKILEETFIQTKNFHRKIRTEWTENEPDKDTLGVRQILNYIKIKVSIIASLKLVMLTQFIIYNASTCVINGLSDDDIEIISKII